MRTLSLFVSLCLSLSVLANPQAMIPAPPQVSATSYILMDARTGKILVEHNADKVVPPASLTKMMTSYVLSYELAQGNVSKDDQVLVSRKAWAQNPLFKGSSLMWIEVGKRVSLSDLHKGVIISSGNDATVAVAEHVSGSEEAFVDLMNQHAQLLGMSSTHFANVHGLPAEQHFTTARDMALLGRALIYDFPDDYQLYAQKQFRFNNISQSNRNRLLWWDDTVDGIKTGHTEEAGYCLVASSQRDDMRLITVVMGTQSDKVRAQESQKLLAYGYRYYQTYQVQPARKPFSESRVWGGIADNISLQLRDALDVTIPRGQENRVATDIEVSEPLWAPIKAGQQLGKVVVRLDDEVLAERPLVAAQGVEEAGLFSRLWDRIKLFFHRLLANAIG